MTSSERLTALDASFLFGEDDAGLLSVGGIDLCSGPAPSYDEFAGLIERRLHLLPRYRQRLAMVPLELGEAAGVAVETPPPAGASGLSPDGEPWPGYDEQTVADIRWVVAELDPGALAQVDEYERRHKGRKGVRRTVASQSS